MENEIFASVHNAHNTGRNVKTKCRKPSVVIGFCSIVLPAESFLKKERKKNQKE